jgi:hypothetical protein
MDHNQCERAVGLNGHIIAPGDEFNEYRPERRLVNVIGAPGDIRNGVIYIALPSASNNSRKSGESRRKLVIVGLGVKLNGVKVNQVVR